MTADLSIYEKALAAGLDARTVDKAQWPFDTRRNLQLEIHAAHDQVLLHAAMLDHPGCHIHIPRLGVGAHVPNASQTMVIR